MIKEILVENIIISLSVEGQNVRVKSKDQDIILTNQSIDTVAELIILNFNIVSNHYKVMIGTAKKSFDFEDIYHVSIAIVLHYLYMYNTWRSMYKKQENKELRFNEKDFSNSSTHDIIFYYLKFKYPDSWEEMCVILLGMESSQLKAYYKARNHFYNK